METHREAVERDILNALFHMREKREPISEEALARKSKTPINRLERFLAKDYNLGTLFRDVKAAS